MLDRLDDKLTIWETGSDLKTEMESVAALTDPSKPSFTNGVQEFKAELTKLNHLSSSYMDDDEIGPLMKCLRVALTNFRLEMEKAPSPSKPSSDTTGDSHSAPIPSIARAAPITVDLPKFSGDSLQWRNFQSMFSAAIRTRAAGFSELDKRCLLIDSVLSKDGKDILNNAPEDATMDDLLDRLHIRFGRPQVVVPLLIQKLDKAQTFTADYEGIQQRHVQVFNGYDTLVFYLKDSFSAYRTYRTTMSFSPKLKEEWDQAVTKKEVSATFEA